MRKATPITIKPTSRPVGRNHGLVDYIIIDVGTSGVRVGCCNDEDESCREVGNYLEAQAGTPSLVRQAPSNIIYEFQARGLAKPVAFGYASQRIRDDRSERLTDYEEML